MITVDKKASEDKWDGDAKTSQKKALELTGIEQIKGFLIQGVSYLPDWYFYLIIVLFFYFRIHVDMIKQ